MNRRLEIQLSFNDGVNGLAKSGRSFPVGGSLFPSWWAM